MHASCMIMFCGAVVSLRLRYIYAGNACSLRMFTLGKRGNSGHKDLKEISEVIICSRGNICE